jgi:hypothetical protein
MYGYAITTAIITTIITTISNPPTHHTIRYRVIDPIVVIKRLKEDGVGVVANSREHVLQENSAF